MCVMWRLLQAAAKVVQVCQERPEKAEVDQSNQEPEAECPLT